MTLPDIDSDDARTADSPGPRAISSLRSVLQLQGVPAMSMCRLLRDRAEKNLDVRFQTEAVEVE